MIPTSLQLFGCSGRPNLRLSFNTSIPATVSRLLLSPSATMPAGSSIPLRCFLLLPLSLAAFLLPSPSHGRPTPHRQRSSSADGFPVYLWPLPMLFRYGDETLYVDPELTLHLQIPGGESATVSESFERYKDLIFTEWERLARRSSADYHVSKLTVIVASADDTLQFGVDESYTLYVGGGEGFSVVNGVIIEANTIYGAVRGLETFSQLCVPNFDNKTVEILKAPWYIEDEPRFSFRGLLIDTSRHYLPVNVIKQVINAMSYAKLNVLHWHIIDEESFPLEVPSHPNLWKGAYSKLERYTIQDAFEVVDFAKKRGIHIMAEIDVPGHAESWGVGYPDIWPSDNCTEPLDVSKNYTFEVISGILTDMRKIFPFGLFHLGGDEVNTGCWSSTPHIKQWLQEQNMTPKEAYQYFVLRAQRIAAGLGWIPVNWEETFNTFAENLNPQTVIHNWLGPGVCPKAVTKGFRCIVSNQGVWYLDHLDIPWEDFYTTEPLDGISNTTQQKLVLGGEVCMWGETADTSDVQQTIWPRAAAAAERLWSPWEATSVGNLNTTVFQRLHYFRCLLNYRGIPAAPVTNKYARRPPYGPGSCYVQ